MACEEIVVQDQQVSAKFATTQSWCRVEQGVQSVVRIHGSRFRPKEVRPGEANNICQDILQSWSEKKMKKQKKMIL